MTARPPFKEKPTICPKCGGEKFRMDYWGKNERRGRRQHRGDPMVLHICRGCGWAKSTKPLDAKEEVNG